MEEGRIKDNVLTLLKTSRFSDIAFLYKPNYGKWCGKGNYNEDPENELDSYCKEHDMCYKRVDNARKLDKTFKEKKYDKCDPDLASSANIIIEKGSQPSSKLDSYMVATAKKIKAFFELVIELKIEL